VEKLLQDLPLARFSVDRFAQLRADATWLERLWAAPTTRVLILRNGSLPVTDESSLIWLKPESVDVKLSEISDSAFLLGATEEHTYMAIAHQVIEVDGGNWVSLRDVGALLTSHDVGLATTATALAAWHRTHVHCTRCGMRTHVINAGWSRKCPIDSSEHYPRTEPAMIVAVEDSEGRILMGRRTEWTPGWYSTLAGFVEAGESSEACVIREVFEESGVHVDPSSLRYLGSQPWPFPASLMLAYRATATSTDIVIEEAEMADVRWFSRDQFTYECQRQILRLPGPTTIAFHLIQDWYGEPIPTEWCRA